jgi:hypothetical protein
MANNADRRIEERTRIARERAQYQGLFDRTMGNIGLVAANTMDKLTSWADDERIVFMGGTAQGIASGAFCGAFLTPFIIAFIPMLLPIGGLVFLASVATGAVVGGAYDGQQILEDNTNGRVPHLSDDVAQAFGTTRKKWEEVSINETPEETLREAGRHDMKVEQRAVDAINRDKITGFAAREDVRRLTQTIRQP